MFKRGGGEGPSPPSVRLWKVSNICWKKMIIVLQVWRTRNEAILRIKIEKKLSSCGWKGVEVTSQLKQERIKKKDNWQKSSFSFILNLYRTAGDRGAMYWGDSKFCPTNRLPRRFAQGLKRKIIKINWNEKCVAFSFYRLVVMYIFYTKIWTANFFFLTRRIHLAKRCIKNC